MFRFNSFYAAVLASSVLLGCTASDRDATQAKASNALMQDRDLGYDRDDYRQAFAPREADEKPDSSIPDLAPVIAQDKENALPQPLVSVTVNQDVSLRDIFFELAQQAEVDLELDPAITGSVIFTAYNRPFDQVVERLSDMAGLRYKFKNGILRVERDTPYIKTYKLDYLSIQRSYTSTIQSNTSAASGTSGGSSGGSNGSSSSISSTSSADFWGELESNITQIIARTNTQASLTDQSVLASAPVAAAAIPVVSTEQLAASTPALAADGTALPVAAAPVAPAPAAAPAASPINITVSTPSPGMANPTGVPGEAGAAGSTPVVATANPYFSTNRQAGLVTIFATEKQHKKVADYMYELRRSVGSQILIEAKVFEVELNDENSMGINWTAVIQNADLDFGVNLPKQAFASDPILGTTTGSFNFGGSDFNILVEAISRFGTVRTLSSPRLTVMNNQTAVLNVSESRVFFDFDIERTEGTANNPPRVDITTEVNNVPEGLIMTVHPSVDPDTNEITMNLRPSITRIVRTVSDPAAFLVSNGEIENLVPELSVREIDSIVKMQSGSTVVMGGLMQDRSHSQQLGIPVLSEVPVIGPLFRNQRDGVKKTEMVILLRAQVVDQANPDKVDRDLYKEMSQDRRPFSM